MALIGDRMFGREEEITFSCAGGLSTPHEPASI